MQKGLTNLMGVIINFNGGGYTDKAKQFISFIDAICIIYQSYGTMSEVGSLWLLQPKLL